MIEIPEFNFSREDWVDAKFLRGKELAGLICSRIKKDIEKMDEKPGLAALIVGDDPASEIYVGSKEKKANSIGFHSQVKRLPQDSNQEDIIAVIHEWNQDENIHGILVQLPLPDHIHQPQEVLSVVSAEKDADGFHFENMGRLLAKERGTIPCTPLGIMVMLNELGESLSGKNAVVLGRSNIVGKPIAQLLLDHAQCTVTVCHSKTKDLSFHTQTADILVTAIGKRNLIKKEDIKKGAIVIDVGIHRTETGICGDLDHQELMDHVSFITPVPGGVGPMTIAMLLYNTYRNFLKYQEALSYIA